jgi:zeaxanthin glucosyltransferase
MHFAAVSEMAPSHFMSMVEIGRWLVARGHQFTFYQSPEMAAWAERESACFISLGDNLRQPTGIAPTMRYLCERLPAAFRRTNVQAVLTDQIMPAGGCVADALNLPFVTVCSALPMNEEPEFPPSFLPWPYKPSALACLCNRLCYGLRRLILAPATGVLNGYRRQWKLPLYHGPEDTFSRLAQITQLVREFDFPRSRATTLRYVGPYATKENETIPFPYDKLDGRPLIYLAFGTQIGEQPRIWQAVAQACATLDLQLVISRGARNATGELPGLPGKPVIVNYAPQIALLKRSALFVSHGGLNSTLEALAYSVPLIIIPTPFTADTPGVAARVAFHGAGRTFYKGRHNAQVWQTAIREILADPAYRRRAQDFSSKIAMTRGAKAAAEIIEEVVLSPRLSK